LAACTCLELLVDRYQTTSRKELIMNQAVFDENLYPVLYNTSREIMKKLRMYPNQRREIYMKLKGLNRRSFGAGIDSLLHHLRIRYDDLFRDLGIITRIRNKITHTGTYDNFSELSSVFERLYVLLTRIFLSTLNYRHDYFDWAKSDWVHFKDVCEE